MGKLDVLSKVKEIVEVRTLDEMYERMLDGKWIAIACARGDTTPPNYLISLGRIG